MVGGHDCRADLYDEPGKYCVAERDAIDLLRHHVERAINYAKFFSRSHDVVIRVFDEAGNVIETHEQAGDFKEP